MSFYYVSVSALILSCASVSYTTETDSKTSHHGKCEPITIPMCKELPYNETVYPNFMGQDKQEDAGLQIHQFWPLVEIKCSPDLKLFLCSVYAPKCAALEELLPPCRSLCESAKMGCEGLMKQYGFKWPEEMMCTKYPEYDGNGSCIDNKIDGTITTITPELAKRSTGSIIESNQQYSTNQRYGEMTSTTSKPILCNTQRSV